MTEIATQQTRTLDRMQVRIAHLDTLLSLAGEVIITAANLQDLERRAGGHGAAGTTTDSASLHLIKTCNQSTRRISQELHDLVMAIRLVEIDETYRLLRRPARDLCRNLGRDAEIVLKGEDVLIDKALAEHLVDPLLHLLRNAIDHGIESPIDRKRAGKPLQGRVSISASDSEHETVITVADDGAGIDEAAVRQAARKLAVPDADTRPLLELICRPGLTTADQVTGTSGRGVGLDLVHTVLDEFDGELSLDTAPGQGSSFTLRVPKLRAVNIIDALTLRAASNLYALPIDKVIANLGLDPADVNTAFDRGRHITYQGRIIPLHDLETVLGEPAATTPAGTLPVIILHGRAGDVAFIVSEFLGPQKLVNIPLDAGLRHHAAVAGTAVFTGGKLGLTIDVDTLVAAAMGIQPEAATAQALVAAATEAARPSSPPQAPDAGSADDVGRRRNASALGDDVGSLHHELAASLAELQDALLTLEQNPDLQDELNRAFRRLHAAKGHFSVLEADLQAAFAHQLETALDYLRAGRLAMTSERMDLLLDGVSYLIASAATLPAAPDTPPTELLAQLQELTDSDTVAAEDGLDYAALVRQPFDLTPTAQLQVLSALKRGERTYETYLEFDPGRQPAFLAAYLLLRRVGKTGKILATLPSVADIEQGRCGREVKILWATPIREPEVDALLERLAPLYHLGEHRSIPTTIFAYKDGVG
ncbi:MAG: ATP-binding protein [Candidatus Krumholzibacteriia bacterium]